jgi:glycogen debranching enzyme
MRRCGVRGWEVHRDRAQRVAEHFRESFLGGPEGGLHDCLAPDGRGGFESTNELRVNQIFAVSLPGSPLAQEEQRRVVELVGARLWTPVGMRTLAPGSTRYRPHFIGDMMSRDDAYHNGTVWPWLSGAFAEAILRSEGFSDASRSRARGVIQPIVDTLGSGCIGQIAEVFDGEERWEGKDAGVRLEGGCPAQAWSVAEPLRLALLIERADGDGLV